MTIWDRFIIKSSTFQNAYVGESVRSFSRQMIEEFGLDNCLKFGDLF